MPSVGDQHAGLHFGGDAEHVALILPFVKRLEQELNEVNLIKDGLIPSL
jgi:hypothetical protein